MLPDGDLLILDLEATCCDAGTVPRHERETIEIGAVLFERESLSIVDEFECLIRPIRHPILTPFCVELTGITQTSVDGGMPFVEAMQSLSEWAKPLRPWTFSSWGRFDLNQLSAECRDAGIDFDLAPPHCNLKTAVADSLGWQRPLGIDGTLGKLGLTFDGTPHRGLDDARNVALIVRHLLGG